MKADLYEERLAQATEIARAAELERRQVTVDTVLEPHALNEHRLAALRASLAEIEGIGEAWLTRRRCEQLPTRPCFVLGVSCDTKFTLFRWRYVSRLMQRIVEEAALPDETVSLCVDGSPWLRERFEDVPEARVQ